jgi:uracil-DNA glycosylase family 4
MADPTPAEVAQQVRQHIQRLQSAGVQWVPAPPAGQSCRAAVPRQTLFAEVPPAAPAAAPDRRLELAVLVEEVKACRACSELAATRTQTVFGVGPLDAELCFIGEAPGADEDRLGEPFVGAAGQLLNKIIAACGMKREEVYICNILRCRPPGNRPPKAEEAASCRSFLDRTIALVQPRFICCLGASAANFLLHSTTSISRMRGRFHDYNGIPVLCTYHPSYLLRSESVEPKRQVWEDMKLLLARMGRPIPPSRKAGT